MSFPTSEQIDRAAAVIRNGGLVAFPTETVYGLGANALDPGAVERIYQAKRRPATSPLIIHVASFDMARQLSSRWPETAERLAHHFWPGPLTVVVPKHPRIPDIVTAGLPTVGLRMPDHSLALALIRAAGVPIAAPSANPFGRLSPTSAEHVREALGDRVDVILDGGSTRVGIESTVVSVTGPRPLLLRPGMVEAAEIESIIGHIDIAGGHTAGGAHVSPGMTPRHYSPRTKLILVADGRLPADGRGAYLWLKHPAPAAQGIAMPVDVSAYASVLYDVLHRLDAEGLDWIAVECPPDEPAWAAILDRLRRASGANFA